MDRPTKAMTKKIEKMICTKLTVKPGFFLCGIKIYSSPSKDLTFVTNFAGLNGLTM